LAIKRGKTFWKRNKRAKKKKGGEFCHGQIIGKEKKLTSFFCAATKTNSLKKPLAVKNKKNFVLIIRKAKQFSMGQLAEGQISRGKMHFLLCGSEDEKIGIRLVVVFNNSTRK
jgi:hypothetical protein